MNDYEIRMWAIQQVGVEMFTVEEAIYRAHELYLYVTAQKEPVTKTPVVKDYLTGKLFPNGVIPKPGA